MAMEKEFGRHRAEVKTLAGVYGAAYEATTISRRSSATSRPSPKKRAAARACWWSRWARTAMTAAPR